MAGLRGDLHRWEEWAEVETPLATTESYRIPEKCSYRSLNGTRVAISRDVARFMRDLILRRGGVFAQVGESLTWLKFEIN